MAKPDYPLSAAEAAPLFNRTAADFTSQLMTEGWDYGNGVLVDDPFNSGRGTVLEVKSYKDYWGRGQSDIISPIDIHPSGVGINYKHAVAGDVDELYMAMDIAVHTSFIWPLGIHTWSASSVITGPDVSALFQLSNPYIPGNPGSYATTSQYTDKYHYWSNDPTGSHVSPGTDPTVTYATFKKDQWNSVEHHFKLNTVTAGTPNADGELQAWMNGVLVADFSPASGTGFIWRDDDSILFDDGSGQFTVWYGGASQMWACPQDQSIFFDNLIISTNRITG